ncbi:hypothetical protein ACWDBO_14615 [Streptomyces mirabilis]|nr:hypothetical protein [Streptomyces sp. AK02-04a]MDX3762294.1 hypothetical protein [Streptomyces sp. AK02-04a]
MVVDAEEVLEVPVDASFKAAVPIARAGLLRGSCSFSQSMSSYAGSSML